MRTLALVFLALLLAGGVFAGCSTPQQNIPALATATQTPESSPTPTPTAAPSSVPTSTLTLSATPSPVQTATLTPPPTTRPNPAQTEPEVATPTALVVVDYQVAWTEVKGFNPSTIPAEEGFYSGEYLWSLYPNTTAGEDGPFPPELEQKFHSNRYLDTAEYLAKFPAPVRSRYAWRIIPHLEGVLVAVAVARDEVNKDTVLASLDADKYGPYLLLSVNGEKSWCKLNLLPITWEGQKTGGVTPEETRITTRGEEIHLYGRYARGPGPSHLYWWEATVNKSELLCS